MTNTIQLTEKKVDMEHWLAVAEKIGQIAEAEAREADKNGHFSPKVAEAIVEGGINKLMRRENNMEVTLSVSRTIYKNCEKGCKS